MKKIIFTTVIFLASSASYAQQCEQKKKDATDQCSPSQLREAREVLDKNGQILSSMEPGSQSSGMVSQLDSSVAANRDASAKVQAYLGKCGGAIKTCQTTCDTEQGINSAKPDPMSQQQAVQDGKNSRYCTQEEPQKNLEEGKKTNGELGQILSSLLGAIAQLMSGQKGEPVAEGDECTPSATRSAAIIMQNPACTTDTASTGVATTFANGDYRSAKGALVSDQGLGAGEPEMGVGAKQELSKGSMGGGGAASSAAPMGAMGNGSGKGNASAKDDKPVVTAGNYGGGGGGKGAGGGGGSSKPGGPVNITKSSMEDERLMQTAVDKALQARGMASEGLPGGITGAHSMDNFLKVERRIQNERNQLNEL